MHMQTEDQVCARDHLQVIDDLVVASRGGDGYRRPVGDRMSSSCGNPEAAFARKLADLEAQPRDLAAGVGDIAADGRADLDDCVVHLPFDLILEALLTLGEHLLNVRFELARVRLDDLKLFFDAEGERRLGWHLSVEFNGIHRRDTEFAPLYPEHRHPGPCRATR